MHGLRKDPTKAIELWQLGCTRPDDSVSCVVLLNELLRGTQVPRDPRRALAVAPSVCGPDPASDACLVLASMLDRGDGLPKDTKRAAIMFDNACAARKETPERCASLRTSGPKELPGTLHDGVTAACTGADVELAGALKSGQCARAGASAPGPAPRVRTALSAPASPVAPGGVARLVFSIANDGKTDATLRFPLDGAMDTTVVTSVNASGKSTSEPMGKFPGPARDEAAARQQAQLAAVAGATSVIGAMGPSPEAVIVLPPHGRAHMEIAWTAIGSSWGPAVKTKEGTTATLVPTPLPAGSYSVSVELRSTHTTPLPKATAQVTVAR
jgi:hypothetical protein